MKLRIGMALAWISGLLPAFFGILKLSGYLAYAEQSDDGDDSAALLVLLPFVLLAIIAPMVGLTAGLLLLKTNLKAGLVIASVCMISLLLFLSGIFK